MNTIPVQQKARGFSLIELMVVVAILAIVIGIGYPSYTDYVQKTRRADAVTLLSAIAGEQQRFFTENNRYATDMTEMGYDNGFVLSENGFYSAIVSASTATSYTATAAPVAGGKQEGDTDCGSFTINSSGVKGVVGADESADSCW